MCAEELWKYFHYERKESVEKDVAAVPEFLFIRFSGLWRFSPQDRVHSIEFPYGSSFCGSSLQVWNKPFCFVVMLLK